MNYLKRRFSSEDLQNERDDNVMTMATSPESHAEFKDINLAAYSDAGTLVDINIYQNGTHVVRSFRPDFILVRQYVRDINIDSTNIILGIEYGAVPSVNSMKALYNFRDKSWIFSELLNIQRGLGVDQFPLISQAYYSNHREMLISPQFPSIIKVGQAHQGLEKIKVENSYDFQDLTSVVAINEDRRCIGELVMHKMQIYCRPDKQPAIMPRIPSVEQPIHEISKVTKPSSSIHDSVPHSTMNMHNISPSTTHNFNNNNNNNRRELPNLPRNAMNIDNKTSPTVS
ncbi:unnamed protein product [Rotaria sp. Silwood1]|nr:unnamed protein product [Rotaria sp. Silwood1]CAF1638770.1 unnamed protein product [Rotaria sp. Silwood1]CAF3813949.1 unnamed protein product [Rotaria sp. Silwood1]CAF3851235.1 unnamed protein product [Rotaria sp. Silwood1]CAF4913311.1 unnamed protein product [Rotaria sp. Silwood1]